MFGCIRETYYMRIYMGVENFAKIESAEICINQYTLLVGPNNLSLIHI